MLEKTIKFCEEYSLDIPKQIKETGNLLKLAVKKVFGRIGNYITDRFSRNRPESEKEIMKRHVKTQANIDSGLKYLDEFANIAMRIGKVG